MGVDASVIQAGVDMLFALAEKASVEAFKFTYLQISYINRIHTEKEAAAFIEKLVS